MDGPRREQLLLGDFEVVRTIGAGGMGVVFEVVSRSTGVRYAAKKVLRSSDPAVRARFRREAELLARCDRHPGIVKVHTFGEAPDGAPCMILDLVEGEGLEKVLEREGRFPARRAAELARDVAAALAFVHERGVLHRDVKPSNILVEATGTPRLTDFGLATASDLERLTKTGQFVGTLFYCAPEQTGGQLRVGPWTDVYALGAVLFHLLGGAPPLEAETPLEHMARLHDDLPVPDVRTLAGDVPRDLSTIVAHALEKQPARRYASCADLARDLDRFLQGQPVAAVDAARRAAARKTRRRLLGGSLAIASLVTISLGARALLRAREIDRALADAGSAIESARHLLTAPGRADKDPVPAIREAIERGHDRLETAARLGATSTGAPAAELDALALELATTLAGRELARGAPARALEILDGAHGPLGPAGHLARARALAGVGRGPDASRELAALIPTLPADLKAEAAEVGGDVFASSGDFRSAAAEYGRALEAGPRAEREVRAKWGGAAALAGDSTTAFACARALLPDRALAALPDDRASNEKLAPLAPALYLRATTATTTQEKLRFLDAANKLAPEPEPLRVAVAQAWFDVAVAESSVLLGFLATPKGGSGMERDVRLAFQHYGRAVKLHPAIKSAPLWTSLGQLAIWARNFGAGNPEAVTAFLAEVLADLPEHPSALFLDIQRMEWEDERIHARALELLLRGLRNLPPREPDESPEVSHIASDLAVAYVRARLYRDPDLTALKSDVELVVEAAEHAGTCDAWFSVSRAFAALKDFKRAHECVERGVGRPRTEGLPFSDDLYLDARVTLLIGEGKTEEARALAQASYDDHPSEPRGAELARTLNAVGQYARVGELFPDIAALRFPDLIQEVGIAAARLGLGKRANQASDRLMLLGHRGEALLVRDEWTSRH